MYDLSFIIPVCDLTKHYFRRFLDLKKYSLINPGDYKTRIKLLTGPGEDFYGHDLTEGWPENIHPEVIQTPFLNPAQKIAHYYATMNEEEIMSARWHAKFDDDTATDIEGTLRRLDEEYEYTDKIYLVTELRHELHGVEAEILTAMGHDHWIKGDRITHEWEGCINSQASLMTVLKNDKARFYFKERTKYPDGFGDQPVGIAMKFCKVPAILPGFMTVWSKVPHFSMFGGPLTHIHFFLGRHDINMRNWDFYRTVLDHSEPQAMKEKMNNRMYSVTKISSFENVKVTFREDNRLINPQGDDKGMWTIYKKDTVALIFSNYPSLVLEFNSVDDSLRNFAGIDGENQAPLSMKAVATI